MHRRAGTPERKNITGIHLPGSSYVLLYSHYILGADRLGSPIHSLSSRARAALGPKERDRDASSGRRTPPGSKAGKGRLKDTPRRTYMCVCIYVYRYMLIYIYIYVCTDTCMYIYIYICICACLCIYVCLIHVFVYVSIEIHTRKFPKISLKAS